MKEGRIVFVVGAPGAGKGDNIGLAYKAGYTGKIFVTSNGLKDLCAEKMAAGELISDDIVVAHTHGWIKPNLRELDVGVDLMVDGGIRRSGQARYVIDVLAQKLKLLPQIIIVHLDLSVDVARARCGGRNRGPDDSGEALEKRFAEYRQETIPAIEMVREELSSCYVRIDAEPSLDKVFEDFSEVLGLKRSAVV